MRLFACSSCTELVRVDETTCPHCGATVRTISAPSSMAHVVLLGLALTGCPSDDVGDDTNAMTSTMSTTTAASESTGSSSGVDSSSTAMEVTTIGEDSAYGTPDTGLTQSDSSTDPSSTSEADSSSSTGDTDASTGSDSSDGTGAASSGPNEPLYGAMDSG